TPSLESTRVLTLGIRATFLASPYPSTAAQSNSHNCLKIVVEFHRHLHHHGSSFDLPVNCNKFWFSTLLLLQFSYPYSKNSKKSFLSCCTNFSSQSFHLYDENCTSEFQPHSTAYLILLMRFFRTNLYEIFTMTLALPNSGFPFGFVKKLSI
ncbi:hypothetical protein BHE74_00058094, partial [Ensete ventricosum]